MEAAGYFHGGYCQAGNPQLGFEKHAKAAGAGDHFIVEDLLDFSNENDGIREDELGFDVSAGNSADSSTVTALGSSSNSSLSVSDPHFAGDLGCRSFAEISLSGDLCVPYDEQAELEWLSNFVEESFSSEDLQKLQLISAVNSSSSSETRSEISTIVPGRTTQTTLMFSSEAPVPGKARSKRSRAAPGSWSSRLLVLSPATSSTESEHVVPLCNTSKRAPKPSKKEENSDGLAAASDGRKCLHCATDKTPQWRTGPMGAKTLCNACGVRYKSGRLVPEYRPAASPTFVLSEHSNSHRKVLELRKQKEVQFQQPPFLHAGSIYEASEDEFLIHHHVGHDNRQLI